jgi:energy-coupling factor transport system substrate-specific component
MAGFFTGFFGNILGDSISFGNFYWPWDLGNGIMGALPGLSFFFLKKEERLGKKGLMYAPLLALAAAAIGMAVAVYLDLCFKITVETEAAAWKVFVSAATTDAINGAVLLPILLLIYAHLVHLVERAPFDGGTGPPG